jgi:hypothetical protein
MFQVIMAGCAGIGAILTTMTTGFAVLQNARTNQQLAAQTEGLKSLGAGLESVAAAIAQPHPVSVTLDAKGIQAAIKAAQGGKD